MSLNRDRIPCPQSFPHSKKKKKEGREESLGRKGVEAGSAAQGKRKGEWQGQKNPLSYFVNLHKASFLHNLVGFNITKIDMALKTSSWGGQDCNYIQMMFLSTPPYPRQAGLELCKPGKMICVNQCVQSLAEYVISELQ